MNHLELSPAASAVMWGGQYGIALMLLKAGADPKVYGTKSIRRLVHVIESEKHVTRNMSPQAIADYEAIVKILNGHGESLEEARKENERWMEWGIVHSPAKGRELLGKEVAERRAREKAEAEKQANEELP